jgi:hypothetical protein
MEEKATQNIHMHARYCREKQTKLTYETVYSGDVFNSEKFKT